MKRTSDRLKALLTAVALGVCCAYAQTATPGGFVLPNADPDADPYDFRMSKTDDGMSVLLILNRIDRTVTDSVVGTCRVSVPGLSSTTFAGLPALPYKAFRIAPEGSGTPQIIVRDSTYIDIPVNLDHNPRIEYDSIGQPHQIAVARVDYSGFMPSDLARVTDTQTYRDRPIYTITVMPMKYDRATGVLRVFTSLDIDIAYTVQAQTQSAAGVTRSAAFNAYTDRMLTEALGEEAVSFSTDRQVATMGIIGDIIGDKEPATEIDLYDTTEDMLVISYKTKDTSFSEATDSLKEWKKNLGYRVHVVERGVWTPEIVDSIIKYHYNHDQNLTTVLIMGTHGVTPLKYRHRCLTDLSYMCMDGPNDSIPDVAYGRVLANCKQHVDAYVAKVIKYEKGLYSSPEVYDRAFLATKYWSDEPNGRFLPTLEDVHSILSSYDIDAQRIYTADPGHYPTVWYPHYQNGGIHSVAEPIPDYLRYPQFAWAGTKYDIINAFNGGVNLGIYNGHGGTDRWSGFTFLDSDCRNFTFTNSAPLVFSIACSTADHTRYANCITAELFRQRSGAIAVIASTFETYLGWSDALLLGMIDAIWPNVYSFDGWSDSTTRTPVYNLYDILNSGHLRLELENGGGYWDCGNIATDKSEIDYNRETFSVFGDPTINYTTKAPTPFSSVTCLSTDKYLTINIGTQELPAKAVIKNLRTGKFITRSITSGSLAPENKISITGDTLEIVVTGHNKVPYREIFCGRTPIQFSKGKIKSVVYDRTTQKATVTYSLNTSGHVSFAVTDLNNNAIQTTIEITEQENKQIIHLASAPIGICVISMMVDGEVVDTYKLLKQ